MENDFFSGQGKIRKLSKGNMERTWRVREKSGNMKINGPYSLQKLYLFCSRGKNVTFLLDSPGTSPSN